MKEILQSAAGTVDFPNFSLSNEMQRNFPLSNMEPVSKQAPMSRPQRLGAFVVAATSRILLLLALNDINKNNNFCLPPKNGDKER